MDLLGRSFTPAVYTRNYAGAASIMRFYAEPISKPKFYVSYAGQKNPDVPAGGEVFLLAGGEVPPRVQSISIRSVCHGGCAPCAGLGRVTPLMQECFLAKVGAAE